MRISAVETFVLSNRRVLVKVSTDEGLAGWGEPVLENWAAATVGAVERMSAVLLGRDPLSITRLWQDLARGGFYRGGGVLSSALAGIDQALWDIKGRAHGVPVHELLGGPCRDRVRAYAHAGTEERLGDLDRAARLVGDGWTLLKVAPNGPRAFIESAESIDRFVRQFGELRETVGTAVDLAIDLHGRLSIPQSRRIISLLEPFMPAFVEEPLRPEHSARIGDIVNASRVPIATGERLYSREEFLPVLAAGIAVAQPDPSHAGGITEVFRIATMAESYDVQLAPHCPLGPVALSACLQVDFAVPNVFAQEYALTPGDLALVRNPEVLTVTDGYLGRPTAPGLGIEVDEDAVRAAVVGGPLEAGSPIWSAVDGGFAEW